MASLLTTSVQTISITISLVAAGGIATLSLFDVPELQSQPASRSLPSIRWLFSRGSHIFPQAAFISSMGFSYLAYAVVPPQSRDLAGLWHAARNLDKTQAYLLAAALSFGIAPFTAVMVPTNFALIKMNEEKGGARSEESAKKSDLAPGQRSAEDSVNSKGDINEFTDISGPQSESTGSSSDEDDEKVRALLGKFARLNSVRALLMASGGVVGLLTALK